MDNGNMESSIKEVFDSLDINNQGFIEFDHFANKLIEYFGSGDSIEDESLKTSLRQFLRSDDKIYYDEFYSSFRTIMEQQNQNENRKPSFSFSFQEEPPEVNEDNHQSPSTELENREESFEVLGMNRDDSPLFSSNPHTSPRYRGGNSDSVTSPLDEQLDAAQRRLNQLDQEVERLHFQVKEADEREARDRAEKLTLLDRIHALEENLRDSEMKYKESLEAKSRKMATKLAKLSTLHESEIEDFKEKLLNYEKQIAVLDKQIKEKDTLLSASVAELKSQEERLQVEYNRKISTMQQELESTSETITELETLLAQIQRDQADVSYDLDDVTMTNPIKDVTHEVDVTEDQSESLQDELTEMENQRKMVRSASIRSRGMSITADMEELIRRLTQEKRQLGEELMESKMEATALRLTNGEAPPCPLRQSELPSLAQEMESLDIQELQSALKAEKETVAHLQDYLNRLLIKIVEHNSTLLEI